MVNRDYVPNGQTFKKFQQPDLYASIANSYQNKNFSELFAVGFIFEVYPHGADNSVEIVSLDGREIQFGYSIELEELMRTQRYPYGCSAFGYNIPSLSNHFIRIK